MTSEVANRCRRWLEEQLEHLRGLANGSSRDAQFKLWRQTTLTVLQRIWPSETSRTERFRRIRFTPPHSKADAATARDWFTRGCDEAASQLTALIAEIDREGVPLTAAPVRDDAADAAGLAAEEEAFPTLDLNAAADRTARTVEIPEERDIVLDLGAPSRGAAAEAPREQDASPAPPSLRVAMPRPAKPAPRATRPSPPARPPADPPRESDVARSRSARRTGAKKRLKEMLGLDDLAALGRAMDPPAPVEPAATASPAPEPAAAVVPEPEPAAAPESAAAVAPEAEPAVAHDAYAPERAASAAEATDQPDEARAAVDDALARISRRAPRRASEPAIEPIPVPAAPSVAPPPAESTPGPEFVPPAADADAEEEIAPELIEEATQRFFESSPVLSLVGRPVQRRTDATRFEHPDAVALATLAEDAGRLGVPEARREAVRSQLVELAQHVELGDPDWTLLAEVVREAMAHRALAQRLMPLLLPWLTRAA